MQQNEINKLINLFVTLEKVYQSKQNTLFYVTSTGKKENINLTMSFRKNKKNKINSVSFRTPPFFDNLDKCFFGYLLFIKLFIFIIFMQIIWLIIEMHCYIYLYWSECLFLFIRLFIACLYVQFRLCKLLLAIYLCTYNYLIGNHVFAK